MTSTCISSRSTTAHDSPLRLSTSEAGCLGPMGVLVLARHPGEYACIEQSPDAKLM